MQFGILYGIDKLEKKIKRKSINQHLQCYASNLK